MNFDETQIVGKNHRQRHSADILIGTKDQPGFFGNQLSLNHKSPNCPFLSATEYVANQDRETIISWAEALGIDQNPDKPFEHLKIEVEDASVDTCLAAIVLVRKLRNTPIPEEWVEYSRLWEAGYTDITGETESSLGALHSALVHVEQQGTINATQQEESIAYANAMIKGTSYIEGLIDLGISPP